MENEIMQPATSVSPVTNSAELIIQQAVDKGLPVETIERLLAMRRELKTEYAKTEYDRAMSKLQGEMPMIVKSKKVLDKFGKERYRYAPIDAIIDQTKEFISKHGFSYAITTEQSEVAGEVKAICTVKHHDGHCEMSTFRVPIDEGAYMTAPQKIGAALTFAKRYAFCNAFGIITGDEDNDANTMEEPQFKTKPVVAPPAKPASPPGIPAKTAKVEDRPSNSHQIASLETLLDTYGMPIMEFLKAYKLKNISQLTEAKAKAAIEALSKRIENGEMWEQPGMPTISTDEPAKVELPPLVQAEIVEAPKPAKWDAWKKEGPRN